MEGKMKADARVLLERYERLKRQYFGYRLRSDSETYIAPRTRANIVEMFEKMGCEIPTSVDQPFTPIPRHDHE